MTTEAKTYPHIERIPDVVGGEPVIKGTRVPVRSIVIHHRLYGGLDDITESFPRVSRAAAEEAMAFYAAHREEIDRYIEENEAEAEARS